MRACDQLGRVLTLKDDFPHTRPDPWALLIHVGLFEGSCPHPLPAVCRGYCLVERDRWASSVSIQPLPDLLRWTLVEFNFHSYGGLWAMAAHSSNSWSLLDSAQEPEKFPLPKRRDLTWKSWLSLFANENLFTLCVVPFTLTGDNMVELRVSGGSKIMRELFYVVMKTFLNSSHCLKCRIDFFKYI